MFNLMSHSSSALICEISREIPYLRAPMYLIILYFISPGVKLDAYGLTFYCVVKNSSAIYDNNSPARTNCCHGCENGCLPQPSSGPVEFLQSSSCSLNFYKRKTNIQLIYLHLRLISRDFSSRIHQQSLQSLQSLIYSNH